MNVYLLMINQEFTLLPAIFCGWDDDDDFYIEVGWLNMFIGASFG
jgi:hypothetical protein